MAGREWLTRRRKIVLFTILSLIAAIVGLLAWLDRYAERRWSAMCERTKVLMAEAEARDSSRPVLRGEPLPGNAWEDYEVALSELAPVWRQAAIRSFVEGDKNSRALVEPLLANYGAALERLRRGTRRADCRCPCPPFLSKRRQTLTMSLLRDTGIAEFAVCQARFLEEAGRFREAAELLLDVCQWGNDISFDDGYPVHEMIEVAVCTTALDELHDVVLSHRLTKEDLLEAERELEILDRRLPGHGLHLLYTRLSDRVTFAEPDAKKPLSRLDAWRYGFSFRLMISDAMEKSEAWAHRAAECDSLSWAEERAVWDDILCQAKADPNPFARYLHTSPYDGRWMRNTRAQIRLLRIAAHFVATGQIIELDDPFGTKILHTEANGKLRIWSVGRDGTDNSGQGNFHGSCHPDDIVLEIQK